MLDHVNAYALVVDDVRSCASFYREKLGFRQAELSEDFAYFTLGPTGTVGLALVGRRGLGEELGATSDVASRRGNSGYFASFLENADVAYEDLAAKGVRFVTRPATRPNGQRFAFFADPEGNLWGISHFPKE